MKNKVYLKHWLPFKPYMDHTAADIYYLQTANRVYQTISSHFTTPILRRYFEDDHFKELSCLLTSYFEDLISGSGIWNTFVRLNKRMYNKPIPFFEPDDYFEEEINTDDIRVLIWYYLNIAQNTHTIDAHNDFIIHLSEAVMMVFEDEWETAPENEQLLEFYRLETPLDEDSEFYQAREFAASIIFSTWLFVLDTGIELQFRMAEVLDKNLENEMLESLLDEARDEYLHMARTRLLSLRAPEWAAEILGETHPNFNDFRNMSQRISGVFSYEGEDQTCYRLKHIAGNHVFHVLKKSLNLAPEQRSSNQLIYLSIVQWREQWWFSGVSFSIKSGKEAIEKEKKNLVVQRSLNTVETFRIAAQEIIENQEKAYLALTNGSQFVFVNESQKDLFIEQLIKASNSLMANKKAKISAFEFDNNVSPEEEGNVLYFNPDGGLEIANVAHGIPDKANPFYDPDKADEAIRIMLYNEDISASFALDCIKKYEGRIPLLETNPYKLYLQDIDFLFRFWKTDNYHTVPAVSTKNPED